MLSLIFLPLPPGVVMQSAQLPDVGNVLYIVQSVSEVIAVAQHQPTLWEDEPDEYSGKSVTKIEAGQAGSDPRDQLPVLWPK